MPAGARWYPRFVSNTVTNENVKDLKQKLTIHAQWAPESSYGLGALVKDISEDWLVDSESRHAQF